MTNLVESVLKVESARMEIPWVVLVDSRWVVWKKQRNDTDLVLHPKIWLPDVEIDIEVDERDRGGYQLPLYQRKDTLHLREEEEDGGKRKADNL